MPAEKSTNDDVAYLLDVIASMDGEFKPNYHTVAQIRGINTPANAQRGFKRIAERNGFNLVQGQGVVKVDENAATSTPTAGDGTPTKDVTPQPKKRGRPAKAKAAGTKKENGGNDTPSKKRKVTEAEDAQEGQDTQEDGEEDEA